MSADPKVAQLEAVQMPLPHIPQPAAITPMEMLSRALSSGASPELLEKLLALQERWEKNQARKAFDGALAAAAAELPVIIKNKTVQFDRTKYRHEDLGEIVRTVDPILAKYGLSKRWRTNSLPNEISVTCIVSHRDGHSEENTITAAHDKTGAKNPIQAIGSTITYLQRYTLKAALGLAAAHDDDGRAAGDDGTISQDQIEKIQALIVEVGADIQKFCKYFKVERIDDLPTKQFENAVAALEAKQKKAK
jgi:hypothetical protein